MATTDCGTGSEWNISQAALLPVARLSAPQFIIPRLFYKMTNPNPVNDSNAALEREVAALIVSALNLEVAPESIGADSDLYGDGLGLDSIDILEIALVVSKQYGIQMKTESDDNFKIFQSLRSLCVYIAEKRSK